MSEIIVHDLTLPDLGLAVTQYFERKAQSRGSSPAGSIYASELGHPCERYLVYCQCHPRPNKLSSGLLKMFDLGDEHEERAIRILRAALRDDPDWSKYDIIQQQMPIPRDNPQGIHGKIDCALDMPGVTARRVQIPLEIKGLSDQIYNHVNTVEDMLTSAYMFIRKYPAQLTLYMYFMEIEWGMFVLVNKQSGDLKCIPYHLDLQYAEELLAKAERVKAAVAAYKAKKPPVAHIETVEMQKCLPARLFWNASLCGKCAFLSMCMPDMSQVPGVECLLGEHELDEHVSTYLRTKKQAEQNKRSYDSIRDHLKAACENAKMKPNESKTFALPHYNVEVKAGERTTYDIPDDVKAKFAGKAMSYRIVTLDELGSE